MVNLLKRLAFSSHNFFFHNKKLPSFKRAAFFNKYAQISTQTSKYGFCCDTNNYIFGFNKQKILCTFQDFIRWKLRVNIVIKAKREI